MKKTIMLTIALVLAISLVFAATPTPHAFEGKIIINDGSLTSGNNLTAQVDGAVTAITTIDDNNYKITVICNLLSCETVEFFINGEKSHSNFGFKAFEVTKANLTFDTIPPTTIGSCGDGICAVEECSFCAIDCSIIKCSNNNVCDAAIGEDLMTAVDDCSICGDGYCTGDETSTTCSTDCQSTSTGSSSSGGGGGGSSGGSSESPTNTEKEIETQEAIKSLSIDIDELNENLNETIEITDANKRFFNWITGFSIQEDGESNSNNLAIILVILIILYFVFNNRKKLLELFKKDKPKTKKRKHKIKKKNLKRKTRKIKK